jgi:hypothetical protein
MINETHRAPPRYKISDFFSSLLEQIIPHSNVRLPTASFLTIRHTAVTIHSHK